MQYDRYPFIDLAVHDAIREQFANGDALIVASPDLRTIHWANGQASELFGYSDIYDLLDDGIEAQPALKRQIAGAIIGLARKAGQDFVIRVTRGFRRMAIGAHAELIELPGGAAAVLISSDGAYVARTDEARGKQIISGFEGTDTHVAVLNAAGKLVAGSPSFVEAAIDSGDLARMVQDVTGEKDRLVKRMVDTPRGPIAAAIGQLSDDPVLHLVFAIEPASSQDETELDTTVAENGLAVADMTPIEAPASFDANRIRHELAEQNLRPDQSPDDELPLVFQDAHNLGGSYDATDLENTDAEPSARNQEMVSSDEVDGNSEPDEGEIAGQKPDLITGSATDTNAGPDSGTKFTFDPSARPVRFVWKINREGAFCEVSPEFAQAVGPNAADIIDRRFSDIARVFNLDPDHEITELLNRRDTWSGKTVNWPVQGTDMVVPVDLAALPTYTRERRFDGFRGFGIVRLGEAVRNDQAIGLALVPGPWTGPVRAAGPLEEQAEMKSEPSARADIEFSEPEDDNQFDDDDAVEAAPGAGDQTAADAESSEAAKSDVSSPPENDPFKGEAPAISLTPTLGRRETDKVINLEARRARARDTLTPLEQAAFKEIGEKLGISLGSNRAKEPEKPDASPEGDPPVSTGTTGSYASSLEAGMFNADGAAAGHEKFTDTRENDAAESENTDSEDFEDSEEARALFDAQDLGETVPEATSTEDAGETDHVADDDDADVGSSEKPTPDALSNLPIRPRQSAPTGLNEIIVDMIPAALLVHIGDRLIHANPEFLELSGFESLAEISAAGGLERLLGEPHGDEMRGGVMLRRADGEEVPVNARLRSINWHDSQALMLALSAMPEGNEMAAPPPFDEQATDEQATGDDETMSETEPDAVEVSENGPNQFGEIPENDQAETDADDRLQMLEIEADELRSILETATDGVVIIGHDNRIRSMNGSACALFGYEEAETREQPFAMLFAHESQRAVMDYLTGLAEHGVSSVLNDGREIIGHEANGGTLPLFMTIGRLSGSQGYCAVMRDITQWKRNEEELREAKRAAETANSHKSDFLARVSHEIRTPLNAIIGFSEMMVEERFGPIGSPRYLEYARDIGSSGKHVLDIVNDLLDISKIEAGQVDLEFSAVSLNDQLAECVSMLQPMANSQRVIIRTSLSATLPEVVADGRSIKQIALNLLSNAVRYTPSGGQIVVSTAYEANGNAVLRIRDTGIGMSRKELEQAMKPFGQVGASARQRGDGTGLGLPLTKAMVEANRARFEIVSAPKEGTLVTITFPPQLVLAD